MERHRCRPPGDPVPVRTAVRQGDGLPEPARCAGDRILAALSPKTLSLAGARAAGAHLYLVTPAHTRAAREILGPEPCSPRSIRSWCPATLRMRARSGA